jgi:hypothetical protein
MSTGVARDLAAPVRLPARMTAGEGLVLVTVLGVGIALRIREALRTPPWFDELFTLWMSAHPFAEMMRLLRGDIHPPLPTLMVAAWRAVGGDGVLWLKTLPIVIGVATLLAVYGFARELFGRRTALVATALLALHPVHVYLSQELRSYGQLALALVLAAWGAWGWTRGGGVRHGVLWAAGMALTMHTHYLGALVLLGLDAWVLLALQGRRERMRAWLAIHVAALIAVLPIAGMFAGQLGLATHHWVQAPTFAALLDYFRKVAYGAWYMVPPLALLALAPLRRPDLRSASAFLFAITLPPLLLAFVLTRYGGAHLFTGRYWYILVPFWSVLFAAGLASVPGRAVRALATVALVLFAGRACRVSSPLREAVALKWAARHSLVTLDYHLHAPRGVLVDGAINLPYYLGSAMVAPARRVSADSVIAVATAGRRWWGVRTESGASTAHLAALLDSLERGGSLHEGPVTIWAGQVGMYADR